MKKVVIEGALGVWAREQYLPFLADKARRGEIQLYLVDVKDPTSESPVGQLLKERIPTVTFQNRRKLSSNKLGQECEAEHVFILTPPQTHCEIASEWLDKAKEIYIEKPLDVSWEAAEELEYAAKNSDAQVFGFDHYLARIQPLLAVRDKWTPLLGMLEYCEVRILEPERIEIERVEAVKCGIILDLGPHALAVLGAFLEDRRGIGCVMEELEIVDVYGSRYRGAPIPGETYARVELMHHNCKFPIFVTLGKNIRGTPDKQLFFVGERATGRCDFDDSSFSIVVEGRTEISGRLDSKPVVSSLAAALGDTSLQESPRFLSLPEAKGILKKLLGIRRRLGSVRDSGFR